MLNFSQFVSANVIDVCVIVLVILYKYYNYIILSNKWMNMSRYSNKQLTLKNQTQTILPNPFL